MEWISVKDRLPEEDVPVLGYWPPMNEIDVKPTIDTTMKHKWYWCDIDEDDFEYAEPTHWMPLPNPPKA